METRKIEIELDMKYIREVSNLLDISMDDLFNRLIKEIRESANPPVVYYRNRIYGILKGKTVEEVYDRMLKRNPVATNCYFFIRAECLFFYWNDFDKFALDYSFSIHSDEKGKSITIPQLFIYAER